MTIEHIASKHYPEGIRTEMEFQEKTMPVIPAAAEAGIANWHPTHLLETIIPALKRAGITEEQLDKMFLENPKKLFGAETTIA